MRVSQTQLSELTGLHRTTIKKQLESLPPIAGKRGAYLYESREALPLIFAVGNLEAARAKHALSQASLNAVREEELRKERIPLDEIGDVVDQMLQALAATLKAQATNGQKFNPKRVNEIFAAMRRDIERLK